MSYSQPPTPLSMVIPTCPRARVNRSKKHGAGHQPFLRTRRCTGDGYPRCSEQEVEGNAMAPGIREPLILLLLSSSHWSQPAAPVGKPVLALQRLFVQPCWPGLPRDLCTQAPVHQHEQFCTSQSRGVNQDQIITVKQRRGERNGKMGVPCVYMLNHTWTKLG